MENKMDRNHQENRGENIRQRLSTHGVRRGLISLMLIAILLAAMSLSGCSTGDTSEEEGTASELGCLASFSADTLSGGTFTQDDIAKKDITVINFWQSSCPPCISEMPALAELEKSLPDNVQLITVFLDGASNKDQAQAILDNAGYEGITLISFSDDLLTVCQNLQFTPTTVLADSEGNLVGDAIIGSSGNLSQTYLEAINKALEEEGKETISLEDNQ